MTDSQQVLLPADALIVASVLLLTVLILSGCSIFRVWNPIYNGMELDQTVAFVEDGVAIEVARFGFANGRGPDAHVKVVNTTEGPVTIRPAEVHLVVGADSLAPKEGSLGIQTLAPGESASIWLFYDVFPVGDGRPDLDGPRGQSLVLVLGTVEAGGQVVQFPSVEYVFPSGDFRGGRARQYPSGRE